MAAESEDLAVALVVAGQHFGLDPATLPDRWSVRQVRLLSRLAIEDRERMGQMQANAVGKMLGGK